MLKAPLISLMFVKMIESLRSFDLIYVMTRGGPGMATETLDMYAFSQGFIESGRISYASGMAVLMMIATVITFTMLWKTGAAMRPSHVAGRLHRQTILAFAGFMAVFPLPGRPQFAQEQGRHHHAACRSLVFTPTLDNYQLHAGPRQRA